MASIGLALPPKRIAVNLAPADVVKEGAHYDLSIALGPLVAIGTVPAVATDGTFVLGKLSRCMVGSSLCRACCRQRWRRLARAWT